MKFGRRDLRYISGAIDNAILSEEAFIEGYELPMRHGNVHGRDRIEARRVVAKTKQSIMRWKDIQQRIWRELSKQNKED